MSTNPRKFEYKLVNLPPGIDVEATLNAIGEEGWVIVGVMQGALHDDVGHVRVLLMREKA